MKAFIAASIVLSALFCQTSSQLIAQTFGKPLIDSLKRELEQAHGREKLSLQLDLANEIFDNQATEACEIVEEVLKEIRPRKEADLMMRAHLILGKAYQVSEKRNLSISHLDTALQIAEDIDNHWYRGEILFRLGINLHRNGEDFEALKTFSQAEKACRASGNFQVLASTYSIVGTIYRQNGLYDQAIDNIVKSKSNYERANYIEGSAWASYLLGRIYMDLNMYEKALEHFNAALAVYEETARLDGNENGLAICHEQIGLVNWELGNYNLALEHIELLKDIHERNHSEYGISSAYRHLGIIYYSLGQYQKSKDYLTQARQMKVALNDRFSLGSILEYLGMCEIRLGYFDKGLGLMYEGLRMAESNKQKKVEQDIYVNLTQVFLDRHNLEKALEMQAKQLEIQQMMLKRTVPENIDQFLELYQVEDKNLLIEELENKNNLNQLKIRQQHTSQVALLLGALLSLTILVFIFWSNRQIRKRNQQLNKALDTNNKLFSIISHDLRGPIGSSMSLSEILVEKTSVQPDSSLARSSEAIQKSLSETYDLLLNLLEWSKSQLNRIEFKPKDVNLEETIQNNINLLSSLLIRKSLSTEVHIDEDCVITADEAMLQIIIRNLLSNAIKYSHEHGKILVSCQKHNQEVEIKIQDHGVGMSQEILDNLFTGDSGTSKPGTSGEKGSGLGLVLVQEFVSRHGGSIRAESQAGEGSVFTVVLPV